MAGTHLRITGSDMNETAFSVFITDYTKFLNDLFYWAWPPGMEFWEQVDEQDVIVENQRGLTLFGCPCFSAKLLFPRMDPSNFQIMNRQKGTLYDMKGSRRPIRDFYPVDANDQGGRWLVDMRYGDVDDQGWVYSWAFRHGRWRGKQGVVRRRLWVREKLAPGATISQPQTTYSTESVERDAAAKSQKESLTTT